MVPCALDGCRRVVARTLITRAYLAYSTTSAVPIKSERPNATLTFQSVLALPAPHHTAVAIAPILNRMFISALICARASRHAARSSLADTVITGFRTRSDTWAGCVLVAVMFSYACFSCSSRIASSDASSSGGCAGKYVALSYLNVRVDRSVAVLHKHAHHAPAGLSTDPSRAWDAPIVPPPQVCDGESPRAARPHPCPQAHLDLVPCSVSWRESVHAARWVRRLAWPTHTSASRSSLEPSARRSCRENAKCVRETMSRESVCLRKWPTTRSFLPRGIIDPRRQPCMPTGHPS